MVNLTALKKIFQLRYYLPNIMRMLGATMKRKHLRKSLNIMGQIKPTELWRQLKLLCLGIQMELR